MDNSIYFPISSTGLNDVYSYDINNYNNISSLGSLNISSNSTFLSNLNIVGDVNASGVSIFNLNTNFNANFNTNFSTNLNNLSTQSYLDIPNLKTTSTSILGNLNNLSTQSYLDIPNIKTTSTTIFTNLNNFSTNGQLSINNLNSTMNNIFTISSTHQLEINNISSNTYLITPNNISLIGYNPTYSLGGGSLIGYCNTSGSVLSTTAIIGDSVFRAAAGNRLIFQSGAGSAGLYIDNYNNVVLDNPSTCLSTLNVSGNSVFSNNVSINGVLTCTTMDIITTELITGATTMDL